MAQTENATGETPAATPATKTSRKQIATKVYVYADGTEGRHARPDVARLEGWGVPKYTAPGLLSAWRRAHREEAHELCDFWVDLTGNVQADIPFPDAYDLAMARWLAHRWGVDFLSTITELYQLYRPWEGKVHRKVYLDEVRVAIGEGPGNYPSDQAGGIFEGLPRRFLRGLPRRFGQYGQFSKDDDDD